MSHDRIGPLAQWLSTWARTEPSVRALFWYGGQGYGHLQSNSDLDAALLLHPSADITRAAEELLTGLQTRDEPVMYQVIEPRERRFTVWLGEAMTKLDVVFGRTAGELFWLSDARDVPPPRLTGAWPVDEPEVTELLQRASLPLIGSDVRLRQERSEQEIDKFLVAFEACLVARTRGDAYSAYFHYNLALGRLARIVQLTRVGYRYLYLPRELVEGLSPSEQEAFRALSGTLRLEEAPGRERALAQAFLAAVDEARRTLDIRQQTAQLSSFLERIQRREASAEDTHA